MNGSSGSLHMLETNNGAAFNGSNSSWPHRSFVPLLIIAGLNPLAKVIEGGSCYSAHPTTIVKM